jgi:type II secretory pathway component GspD/PulD (secretin)
VVHKVPILGDIPILGLLFRSSREVTQKTSLLILITPHVIATPEDMEKITEEKKKEGEAILPGKL